ncbi:carbohydrate ABC transporter permease [Gryllotalpicola ginsengisoli]|uniref:carbohydrate ABC transporter permease n=1 Tax=Gryllotalpicola ginsengisoli TaxID=444608 RepID=UPI000489541D|nr:sugar ABC transporter permease [Gryllotalpicola ginsengisoli]
MSRRSGRAGEALAGYAMLAPSLFGLLAFLAVPIGVVVWLSFQNWDLIAPLRPVGLANWRDVLTDPDFGHALLVTALFALMVVPVQTALALLLAVLLTRGLPGSALFRVIYVIPWVCAPLALGLVWKWIFAPSYGALNAVLGTHTAWLTEPALALPAIAAVTIWSQVGYVTLFFIAGLSQIPDHLLEAARVDGAGPVRVFFSITLPLLRPTMFFVLVTSVISAFQVFDTVYALTQGGPQGATDVVAYAIYHEAFTAFDLGHAAVMALVLFAVLVVVTLAQQLYFRRRISYEIG